ncbi:DNA methyltransferase, partial [Vibrio anguillarum]|nr:DNA methyltransferase [Vibrio anguillarum]
YPLGAIGRYRPNKVASSSASDVNEFLVIVKRTMVQLPQAQSKTVKAIKPVLVGSYE